jgi:TolA-binding protein
MAAAPNPAGLLAHYQFEGDAVDTSGLQPSADGTLFGNPNFEAGVFGLAIGLDGDGDYVDCGNGSFFNITDRLTVTAWIKVNEFDKKYQTIISKGDNSWRLARVGDSNNVEFACNGTAATRWTGVGEIPWAVSGTASVNDGKWHHIAGVFDGTQLYLYIDGVLEAAKAAAKSIDISSYNVYIGANAQVAGREWNGFIDDVRIYNYALSQSEIVSVMGENEINLLSRFPAALYDIAKRYDGLNKFEEAKGVCRLILQNHPDSPSARGAQLYLARRNIMSLIKSKEYTEAQAELDTLIADFNDHPDFAESLCAIAQSYEWPRKFEKAESLYERAARLDPNNPYVIEAQFNWPKLHIFSLIKSENYTDANVAIDKFVDDFAEHPALPGVLYWFAKEFEASKAYEEAKSIYQQVVQQYPDSSHAAKAWLGFYRIEALSLIEAGDDAAAQAALDILIADFNDHSDLAAAVFAVGERYYNWAFQCENQGLAAESEENFQKAIAVWERIITELPPSPITPQAYFSSAECCRRLGKYEKAVEYFQAVVDNWPDYEYAGDAQFLIGTSYERLRNGGSLPESEANPKIEQAYKSVVDKYPDCASAKYSSMELGRLSFKKGEWASAAQYLELCLNKYPENQGPRYLIYPLLGRAYEEMAEFDLAARFYGEFIKVAAPGDRRVKSVKTRLEALGS